MYVEVHLHGRTGDGKTTLAALIAERKGAESAQHQFVPDNGAHSATRATKVFCIDGYAISDNPGLMDTHGDEQDELNLRTIVNHARKRKCIHAFVIVINKASPRFDSGMQNAVKLLIDSFGKQILGAFALVYTRAVEPNVFEECEKHAEQVAELIQKRANLSQIPQFPWFCVEAHPDNGLYNNQTVQRLRRMTDQSIDDLLRWARNKPMVCTEQAIYGTYDSTRKLQEAQKKAAEEKKRRKEAERTSEEQKRLKEIAERNAEEQQRKKEDAERVSREERRRREEAEETAHRREQVERELMEYSARPNDNVPVVEEPDDEVEQPVPNSLAVPPPVANWMPVISHAPIYSLDVPRRRGVLGVIAKALDATERTVMGNQIPGAYRVRGVTGHTAECLDRLERHTYCTIA